MTNKSIATTPAIEKKETFWWEKTVEYMFILNASKDFGIDLLSPLDGDVEAIGDAISGKNNRYFIIEFKRRPGDFSAEYDKFALKKYGYRIAKKVFSQYSISKSHYVIAGRLGKNAKSLSLCFMNYFNMPVKLPIGDVFQTGMSHHELIKYTEAFTFAKLWRRKAEVNSPANEDSDDSDGCDGGVHKGTKVLAMDHNKNVVILPLSYFASPKPGYTPQNGPGSPSGPQPKTSPPKQADKKAHPYNAAIDNAPSTLKDRSMKSPKEINEDNKKTEDSNPKVKKQRPKM